MPCTFTHEQIATACAVPLVNVQANAKKITNALDDAGIGSDLVYIAALATVATETNSFLPVTEKMAKQDRQPELYAQQMRYFPFIGRGFVQITWENNYRLFGSMIGVDLIQAPNAACDPDTAALILAAFFKHNNIDKAANAQDWRKVRKLVNGGYNGLDRFQTCVSKLLEIYSQNTYAN